MRTTKIIALAALFVAGLTFTSCKKSYRCDCTVNGVTTKGESAKYTKTQAATYKSSCELYNSGDSSCKWIAE